MQKSLFGADFCGLLQQTSDFCNTTLTFATEGSFATKPRFGSVKMSVVKSGLLKKGWCRLKSAFKPTTCYIFGRTTSFFYYKIFGARAMNDEQEKACVERFLILLLGVDNRPVPSIVHLDKELFVLSEAAPRVANCIKFSPSPNGPHSELVYTSVGDSSEFNKGSFVLDAEGVRLTGDGRMRFQDSLSEWRTNPFFSETKSASELIRMFFDDLTKEELLLLMRSEHSGYFSSTAEDAQRESQDRETLSLEMFRNNKITESKYEELVGHPID